MSIKKLFLISLLLHTTACGSVTSIFRSSPPPIPSPIAPSSVSEEFIKRDADMRDTLLVSRTVMASASPAPKDDSQPVMPFWATPKIERQIKELWDRNIPPAQFRLTNVGDREGTYKMVGTGTISMNEPIYRCIRQTPYLRPGVWEWVDDEYNEYTLFAFTEGGYTMHLKSTGPEKDDPPEWDEANNRFFVRGSNAIPMAFVKVGPFSQCPFMPNFPTDLSQKRNRDLAAIFQLRYEGWLDQFLKEGIMWH